MANSWTLTRTFHHAPYDTVPELSELWKLLPVRNQLSANHLRLLVGTEP